MPKKYKDCAELGCPFHSSTKETLIVGGICEVTPEECPRKDDKINKAKVIQVLIHKLGYVSNSIDKIRGFLSKVENA